MQTLKFVISGINGCRCWEYKYIKRFEVLSHLC